MLKSYITEIILHLMDEYLLTVFQRMKSILIVALPKCVHYKMIVFLFQHYIFIYIHIHT